MRGEAENMSGIKAIAAECLGISLDEMRTLSPDAQFQLLERDRRTRGHRAVRHSIKPRGNMLAVLGKITRSEEYTERARSIHASK